MGTQINSADIISISKSLNNMYNNYIIDNKYVFNYLKNISDPSLSTNLFNKYIQLLFTSDVSSGNMTFFDKTKYTDTIDFTSSNTSDMKLILKSNAIEFIDSLNIIHQIYKKSYDWLTTNGIDKISNISSIKLDFVNIERPASLISRELTIPINRNKLSNNVYTMSPNVFNKATREEKTNQPAVSGISYMDLSPNSINTGMIINNYIFYLLNMKSTNAKMELLSILNIMDLFINTFIIRVGFEIIINTETVAKYSMVCNNYITTAHDKIKTLINDTNNLTGGVIQEITNIILDSQVPSVKNNTFVIKTKLTTENSTAIDIPYRSNMKNKTLLFELDVPENKISYEIYKINYDPNPITDTSIITSIVLKDVGSDFFNQYNSSIAANSNIRFKIREKGINDFKLKYMETGIALRDINKYIDDYKREINRNVDLFTKNKNKSKNLNFHSKLYYIIFALLIIITIAISLNNYEKNTKITALIIFIAITVSMIIYNHGANDYYISDYNDTNKDKIDFANANMQTKSFYIIAFILIIGAIALSVTIGIILTIDISKLITIVIFIAICLIISLIIYRHVSFEKFTINEKFATSSTINIANIGVCPTTAATADRINYCTNSLKVYISNVLIYISNLVAFIPSVETKDLYSTITDSIDNEKKSFTAIQKEYYMRNKQTLESTNLLKHSIISNYSFIIMISYLYLICILIYFAYLIDPLYIKIYLFIGAFIYFFVIWLYYVSIVQPVRVNSSNKYWIKPSQSMLIRAGI